MVAGEFIIPSAGKDSATASSDRNNEATRIQAVEADSLYWLDGVRVHGVDVSAINRARRLLTSGHN